MQGIISQYQRVTDPMIQLRSSTDAAQRDLRNSGYLADFNYYWNEEDTPQDIELNTSGNVFLPPGIIVLPYGDCVPMRTRSREQMDMDASLHKQAADELRTQHSNIVDGGDTEFLLSEVMLTQYGEALELYYELMSKSPSLSIEVMVEAIQKEAELPAALLTLILESNPQAAKSKEIEEKLDQRSIPLEEYMRDMIDQGLYIISSKEALEARLSHHASQYHNQLNHAIIEILHDPSIVDKTSAIDAMVTGRETLDQRYLRIALAIEEEQFSTAQSLIDDLAQDFDLDTRKDQEYQDYMACFDIQMLLLTESRETLSTAEQETLSLIADKHQSRAAALAQSLLTDHSTLGYAEILVHPDDVDKSYKQRRKKPRNLEAKGVRAKIFPNPASDYLVYRASPESNIASVQIMDAQGKSLPVAFDGKSFIVIDISSFSNGRYTVILYDSNGERLDAQDFVIQK